MAGINGIWVTDQQHLVIDSLVRSHNAERLRGAGAVPHECPWCYEFLIGKQLRTHLMFECTLIEPEARAVLFRQEV